MCRDLDHLVMRYSFAVVHYIKVTCNYGISYNDLV